MNKLVSSLKFRMKEAIKLIEEGNNDDIFDDLTLLVDRIQLALRVLYKNKKIDR